MSTIILVDDQPIANFITRKLLEIEGYNEDVPRLMDDLRAGKYTDTELDLIDIHESETQGITFFKK